MALLQDHSSTHYSTDARGLGPNALPPIGAVMGGVNMRHDGGFPSLVSSPDLSWRYGLGAAA